MCAAGLDRVTDGYGILMDRLIDELIEIYRLAADFASSPREKERERNEHSTASMFAARLGAPAASGRRVAAMPGTGRMGCGSRPTVRTYSRTSKTVVAPDGREKKVKRLPVGEVTNYAESGGFVADVKNMAKRGAKAVASAPARMAEEVARRTGDKRGEKKLHKRTEGSLPLGLQEEDDQRAHHARVSQSFNLWRRMKAREVARPGRREGTAAGGSRKDETIERDTQQKKTRKTKKATPEER